MRTLYTKAGKPYPEERECEECHNLFKQRFYNSGQKEPPCNFLRRTTCGKQACIQSQRRRKLEAGKKIKAKKVEVIDLFIYGGLANVQ